MSKRSVYTTITPLPPYVTRDHVMSTFRSHVEMIDLNPLVVERHIVKPPQQATPEEFHCVWYEVTDRISYLPGISGNVKYPACFHDLPNGIQTHILAPMGLEIRGKWTLGGNLPGEKHEAVELGLNVPKSGLYIREDVDMKCNIMLVSFVKSTTKKAHAELVNRLSVKAQLAEVKSNNERVSTFGPGAGSQQLQGSPPQSYAGSVHSSLNSPGFPPPQGMMYPDPLNLRTQSPFNPSLQMQNFPGAGQGQYDPRISTQSGFPSPGFQGYASPHQHQHQQGYQSPGMMQDPAFAGAYAQNWAFQQQQQLHLQQQQQQQQQWRQQQGMLGAGAPVEMGGQDVREQKRPEGAPPMAFAPVELPAMLPGKK